LIRCLVPAFDGAYFSRTPHIPARFVELTFADTEKIEELARKTGTLMDLAAVQAMEHAFASGRGAIRLLLTEGQYKEIVRKS